jgi:hypothetical protein
MDEYNKISLKLGECEELYENNSIQALKNMIDLYEPASEVFNHDVCDAIDIWLSTSDHQEILDYLKSKLDENTDIGNHYVGWIEQITHNVDIK